MPHKLYVSDVVNYDKHANNKLNNKLELLRTVIQSNLNLKNPNSQAYNILQFTKKSKK